MRRIGVGDWQPSERERQYVNQVLDSCRISYGPFSRKLEAKFSGMHGCEFGVLSNSGTSSLQVALQALKELHGWDDGGEVIVPSVTFCATVNIVLHNRMKPVLVDVESDYYGVDVSALENAITPNTRAIIPVHLFGQSCDMSTILSGFVLERRKDIRIIEDSCECVCGIHYNKPVGSWGDIGVFSFYVAHIITSGVGGIATTNNPDYAAKMRSLVNHGRDGIYIDIDDDCGLEGEALREVVSRRFNFESIGHSFRVTELEASLALAQLETWQDNIEKRQANAEYLGLGLECLEDKLQLPKERFHTSHSYMMFPIVLLEGSKWDLINYLEERGIETRELLRLTDQPCYKGLWNPDDYPVAKWLNERGYYVGVHPGLTTDDLDYIIDTHKDYFNER